MPYTASSDLLATNAAGPMSPARLAVALTPSDSTDLTTYAKALWVGGAGNIAVVPVGAATDTPVTLVGAPAGALIPLQVRRVMATGTTATGIVALFG